MFLHYLKYRNNSEESRGIFEKFHQNEDPIWQQQAEEAKRVVAEVKGGE